MDKKRLESLHCSGEDFYYLAGLIKADGSINSGVQIELADEQLIMSVKEKFNEFEYKETYKEGRVYHFLRAGARTMISKCLLEVLTLNKLNVIETEKRVPHNMTYAFLHGFFDGDGSIFLEGDEWCMDFVCNINEVGLIMSLMGRLGIIYNVHHHSANNVIELRIKNRSSIREIADNFKCTSISLLRKEKLLDSVKASNKLSFSEELRIKKMTEDGASDEDLIKSGFTLEVIRKRRGMGIQKDSVISFNEFIEQGILTKEQIISLTGISRNTFYNRVKALIRDGFSVDKKYYPIRRKLTNVESEELNKRIKNGENAIDLSREYGISLECIRARLWKINKDKMED